MKVAVLGAGVVGTATAWYLAQAGHEVIVVDRQPEPGLETSYANGGQISVSHARPWANSGAPGLILKWLGREDAPLLFRPSLEWRQWSWGLRFLFECFPFRTRANTRQALALARFSAEKLAELRAQTGICYDQETRGILQMFFDTREFDAHCEDAQTLRDAGLEIHALDPSRCLALEPALKDCAPGLAGGLHAVGDESGDARKFTVALARLARDAGVQFRHNIAVRGIELEGGRVRRLVIDDEVGVDESLRADAYVVALGSYSPLLLETVGISIPVYPVKGYSMTLPLRAGDVAPRVSLSDDSHKLVFSRLGERLRVAGTAELNGYDTSLNEARCAALLKRTRELFPALFASRGIDADAVRARGANSAGPAGAGVSTPQSAGREDTIDYWTGLRPATPSNLPYIGRTRYPNLYLNTGHGTLGWTLACGSGAALAEIVSGREAGVDFNFWL